MDVWSLVRFVHVLGAILWVGGQVTVSMLVLPVARRRLGERERAELMRTLGLRLGVITMAGFIPVQVATGVLLAWHKGVTWASLGDPGYGRTLAGKLVAFVLVMLAAGLHGWANGVGRRTLARSLALASLIGSLVVVLLATALPVS
ncbi:hypothetical protein N866_00380 [Actinotalea ferrariae CF5-4]|uniref:Copper resistance protein D domain-containing protein n=1 Tax=Actinotalea ferrariae CF5-4 TaxID=948458 RepID=A0A021W1Q3_9CELL|nr:hypothetical protein [Actinotalea ferrariae]EYR65267.1 hypothetical protein N866_00380 [Actinotalea ferrariae CF5-4]